MKDDGNSTGATVWTGGAGVEGAGVEGAGVEGAGVEGAGVGVGVEGVDVEGAGVDTTAASAEPVTLLLIGWKPTALAVTVMVAD